MLSLEWMQRKTTCCSKLAMSSQVCTIHQPSIDIFEAFDELLLLKRGGRTIYCGPLGKQSVDLVSYFEVCATKCGVISPLIVQILFKFWFPVENRTSSTTVPTDVSFSLAVTGSTYFVTLACCLIYFIYIFCCSPLPRSKSLYSVKLW